MATSGTVGRTLIDTAKILEHAFRRAKLHPSRQTPEVVDIAKQNLYFVMLNLANRGLNLWCVESKLLGLYAGQQTYEMPVGTINLQNVVYCKTTRADGTASSTNTSVTYELAAPTQVSRIGIRFSSAPTVSSVSLSTSDDGTTFSTRQVVDVKDVKAGQWVWVQVDPILTAKWFRISAAAPIAVETLYIVSSVMDYPVIQWNRDTWAMLNNKARLGSVVTNYYLEKRLTPRISLWPIPNNDYDHLMVFLQRQVQDVGALSNQIEVPQRWLDAVIWQLALRLAFETDVDGAMIPTLTAMAEKALLDAEREEADGAPLMLAPNIGVYTK